MTALRISYTQLVHTIVCYTAWKARRFDSQHSLAEMLNRQSKAECHSCTICRGEFSLAHGGLNNIEQHAAGLNTRRMTNLLQLLQPLALFCYGTFRWAPENIGCRYDFH